MQISMLLVKINVLEITLYSEFESATPLMETFVMIKAKLKVKFTLEQATKAHRGVEI
jgi:hypothetical protein